MYSYTLSLTLDLDEGGGVQRDAPAAVPRQREPVPIVQETRTTEYVHYTNVTIVTSPNLGGTEYYISFANYSEILQTGIILVLNHIRTLSRFWWLCAEKAAYEKGCLVFRVC